MAADSQPSPEQPDSTALAPIAGPDAVSAERARAWLDQVRAVRAAVRQARPGFWFPLLVFGLAVATSAPLYVSPSPPANGGVGVVTEFFPGGMFTADPARVAVYWLVALPIALLLTAVYYGLRARRRGVAVALDSFILASLGMFAVLVLGSLTGLLFYTGDLAIRGLLPLFVVAAALIALAATQRSAAQLTFSLAFLALCVVANLYDLENIVYRLIGGQPGSEWNAIIAGAALLLGAAGFGVAALVGRRR